MFSTFFVELFGSVSVWNFVELFLNLQDRATRFNEYEPDNELSEITTKIKEMKSEEIQR